MCSSQGGQRNEWILLMLNQVPALLGPALGLSVPFFKEKSKFPLAYTNTVEVLALEELLCGVCSVRAVLSC